jgi:hypothetical protein
VVVVVVDRDDDRLRLRLRLAQRGDDVDSRAIGQAEVDQGDVDLLLGDHGERRADARRLEVARLLEDFRGLHLEPVAGLGDVFQQQDVRHGELRCSGLRSDRHV